MFINDYKINCIFQDQRAIATEPMSLEDILAEGGCKYTKGDVLRNGEERHSFHSTNECIICKCKVSVFKHRYSVI